MVVQIFYLMQSDTSMNIHNLIIRLEMGASVSSNVFILCVLTSKIFPASVIKYIRDS